MVEAGLGRNYAPINMRLQTTAVTSGLAERPVNSAGSDPGAESIFKSTSADDGKTFALLCRRSVPVRFGKLPYAELRDAMNCCSGQRQWEWRTNRTRTVRG